MAFRHVKPLKRFIPSQRIRNLRTVEKNNADGTIDCVVESYDPSVNDLPQYQYNNIDAMILRGDTLKQVDSKVLGINPNSVEDGINQIIGKEDITEDPKDENDINNE